MNSKYFKSIIVFSILMTTGLSSALSQCYPDRHNTNWFDGWISCETAPNPNAAYGESHWILYDLNETYELGQMHVWNTNDPERLEYGMQEVSIDFSVDGSDWQNLGTYTFDMGTGKSIYEGFEGPDFEGAVARYVLISGISNYGGECYGLSEIRIAVEEHTVFATEARFNVNCSGNDEGILLEWTVQGELNQVHYQIDRSEDKENWTTLKETEKFTLQDGTHTFHYIDNGTKEGSAYYRLISHGADGKQQQSNDHYCSQNRLDARIYPNPVQASANLEILSNSSELIRIQISDLLGKIIYENEFIPHSISNAVSLEDLSINRGQYFVTVRQGDEIKTVKLIRM